MDQQFLCLFNLKTNPEYQKLPNVFKERFYDDQDYIFVNGNNRYRYICLIRVVEGEFQLYGHEWGRFVQDNLPSSVKRLHFVKESLDTFYVTGYNEDGSEGPGYDRRVVGRRVVRCLVRFMVGGQILPGDFLQDIWKDTFKIYANGLRVKVRHERVKLDANSVVRSNRLFGNSWERLVDYLEIDIRQPMVFTNLGDNKLKLALFRNDGTCLYPEIVYPTLLRVPGHGIPLYAMEDRRAHHICTWEGHTNHNDENAVFHVKLNGIVLEFYHVTLPVDFAGHQQMHAYNQAFLVHDDERFPVKVRTINDKKRTNREQQVKLTGNFRTFANMCGFRIGKLMRFKFVDIVLEVVDGQQNVIPVFHVFKLITTSYQLLSRQFYSEYFPCGHTWVGKVFC